MNAATRKGILERAAERGEHQPEPGLVADAVLGPLYFRSLWGILPTDPEYPRTLVERLLSAGPMPDGRVHEIPQVAGSRDDAGRGWAACQVPSTVKRSLR